MGSFAKELDSKKRIRELAARSRLRQQKKDRGEEPKKKVRTRKLDDQVKSTTNVYKMQKENRSLEDFDGSEKERV
jgi:hypothetical protein